MHGKPLSFAAYSPERFATPYTDFKDTSFIATRAGHLFLCRYEYHFQSISSPVKLKSDWFLKLSIRRNIVLLSHLLTLREMTNVSK